MEGAVKKVWLALLAITSLISVGFLVKTTSQLNEYFSLNGVSKAISTDWEILEKSPSSFALLVSYQFIPTEKGMIQGKVELAKPHFLNHPSAERAVKDFSKKSWDVFYNSQDPSISSLQKIFPFKDCIQTLLTFGVFVYFLFFKKMMEKSTQEW